MRVGARSAVLAAALVGVAGCGGGGGASPAQTATTAPPAPAPTAQHRAPALLLAGDHDLSTPLEWARAQQRRMPDARLVVVRGAGHSILSREQGTTGRTALREFLAARS